MREGDRHEGLLVSRLTKTVRPGASRVKTGRIESALVKPMPSRLTTASLAESWSMSKDGRVWEFVLRKGPRFHNGETVTAEAVKFSFERYRGAAGALFTVRVRGGEV